MRPEFGNLEQIELLRLEERYKSMKPILYKFEDGSEVEICPYCKAEDVEQFTEDCECVDCGREAFSYYSTATGLSGKTYGVINPTKRYEKST